MSTDFSSLDKLVEFGLGLGIATQMMNTMNQTIAQTAVPGVGINPGVVSVPQACAPQPVNQTSVIAYYIVKDERLAGPLNESEISRLVDNDSISGDTLCWRPSMNTWKFAKDIPEINKLFLLKS